VLCRGRWRKRSTKEGKKKNGGKSLKRVVGWEGRERKEGKQELHVEEIIE
jgi:hypothetical protein